MCVSCGFTPTLVPSAPCGAINTRHGGAVGVGWDVEYRAGVAAALGGARGRAR